MQSYKQIWVGLSTLITGALLQTVVAFRASSIGGPVAQGVSDSGHSAEQMDYLLEQSHIQMLWMFAGWSLGWLLIAVGAILVIWGVYRHISRKKPSDGMKAPSTTA